MNIDRPFADIGPTSLPTSPDVGPMCLCCLGDNVARKLRFAHLRILTISGHVIVVSAQQRAGCKLNAKWKWIRGRLVFFIFFRRFHCRRLYWFVLETIVINSDASAAKEIYSPHDHGYLK